MTTKCTSTNCDQCNKCGRHSLDVFIHQSDLSKDGFCHANNFYKFKINKDFKNPKKASRSKKSSGGSISSQGIATINQIELLFY